MEVKFSELAKGVDQALTRYQDYVAELNDLKVKVQQSMIAVSKAKEALDESRDALFDAFPELRPSAPSVVAPQLVPEEQDDPDDLPEFRETS